MKRWIVAALFLVSLASSASGEPSWKVSVGRDGQGYNTTSVAAAAYKFLPLRGWTCTLAQKGITDAAAAMNGLLEQRLLFCEAEGTAWGYTLVCPKSGDQWWEFHLVTGTLQNNVNVQIGCKSG